MMVTCHERILGLFIVEFGNRFDIFFGVLLPLWEGYSGRCCSRIRVVWKRDRVQVITRFARTGRGGYHRKEFLYGRD